MALNNVTGQFTQANLEALAFDTHKKSFLTACGQFGGRPYESVNVFIKKVNDQQIVTSVSNWNCAKIVVEALLTEEAAVSRQRWEIDVDNFPNVAYWSEQDAVEPRPMQRYKEATLRIPEVAEVAARDAVGDPADPVNYRPAVLHQARIPEVPADPGQPELPPIRREPAVTAEKCLRHYLFNAFDKTMDPNAARTRFDQYRKQDKNTTLRCFLNQLFVACGKYHAVRYTEEERRSEAYKKIFNREMMDTAVSGCNIQFRRYFENYNTTKEEDQKITDFRQFEQLAIQWESGTEEGQELQKRANVFKLVSAVERPMEPPAIEPYDQEFSLSSAAERGGGRGPRGQRRGSRAMSAGAMSRPGGRGFPPRARAIIGTPGLPPDPITDSRYPDYWKDPPKHLQALGNLCFFCGCAGHGRPFCPHLRRRRKEGEKDIPCLQNRGSVKSFSQIKRDKIIASAMAGQARSEGFDSHAHQRQMAGESQATRGMAAPAMSSTPTSIASVVAQRASRAVENMSDLTLSEIFRASSIQEAQRQLQPQSLAANPSQQGFPNAGAIVPFGNNYHHAAMQPADVQSVGSVPYSQL